MINNALVSVILGGRGDPGEYFESQPINKDFMRTFLNKHKMNIYVPAFSFWNFSDKPVEMLTIKNVIQKCP